MLLEVKEAMSKENVQFEAELFFKDLPGKIQMFGPQNQIQQHCSKFLQGRDSWRYSPGRVE